MGCSRTSQLLTDKVAARPQTRLLDSKEDKPIIILCQSQIKKQIGELGLETNQKKEVLDPKLQGIPVRLGNGGFWRWSPASDSGQRIRYVCIHGKRKETCKECGGSGICVHKHHRRFCKQCQGTSLCWHGVQKSRCTLCRQKTSDPNE